MPFRMLTHNGLKIAVPVNNVRLVLQDVQSPTHSIVFIDMGHELDRVEVDEEFSITLARLNTLAD